MDFTVVAEFVKATKCTGSATVELFAGEQMVTEGRVGLSVHCAKCSADARQKQDCEPRPGEGGHQNLQ